MKKKVSFDFDECLDEYEVQEYCRELIKRGYDVWICTARTPSVMGGEIVDSIDYGWNRDVFKMCKTLGIPADNVIMTNCGLKSYYLNNKGFMWHLDDMDDNIEDLNLRSDCQPVLYSKWNDWRGKCEEILK